MGLNCRIFTTAIPFLLFSSSLVIVSGNVLSRDNRTESDRLALLSIKSKIDDGPSHVLRSWNYSSLSFCKWQGITCGLRHQRVIKLNLSSLGLVGSLSPHVGNLTFLRTLLLFNNTFHDQIPPQIGRLYKLRNLKLFNNTFVGEIPVNLSHCINLNVLDLSRNQLVKKIPLELSSLSKLVSLILDSNHLSGRIPPWIGNFSSLKFLSLNFNSFQGSIPNSLGQLKSLIFLGLGVNMLSGTVPPLLYNISSLTIITLTSNNLTGSLPQNIGLPNLQSFFIGGNRFSGTLPVSLFNVSGLQNVDLSHNSFISKVPLEVGNLKDLRLLVLNHNSFGSGATDSLDFLTTLANCSHLQVLDFGYNQFGGVLPNSITNQSRTLFELYLGGNQLHGSIPSGFQSYADLFTLGMEGNFFTGSIPFSIGRLHNLQKLLLGRNGLEGELPASLDNLTRLYTLYLSDNMLEGNIISSIAKCQSLARLYLSTNKFHGSIPEGLIDLSSQLLSLDLSHNSLTGSLPIQLGSFKTLQFLSVYGNKLSGEIPNTIGGCSSLQDLSLRGNFFSGVIPTSLKSLYDLRSLDLSMNNFSGEIPKVLGNLTMLQYVDLSFNNLEGSVPTKGVFKNASTFSVEGNHKLCGGITELQLTDCPVEILKKRNISLALKVSLGVFIPLIVVTIFVVGYLIWKTNSKEKPSTEPVTGPQLKRVSYHDLCQATNGFSSDNLIGVGSFGCVYKGILNEDEGLVAIKVLNLSEHGASKSFITECDALRNIRHRNLVKILTICSSVDLQGLDFRALVLQFMSNGSIESILHPSSSGKYIPRSLTLLERLNIAIDIASALDYLHNHCVSPIVHRDLKPSNILLDGDMTAHVGDFGLAKFLSKSTSNFNEDDTNSISPRGTIGYIPPEYGSGGEVSTQGDVYSYGTLLLEMMTRKRPTDDIFKDGITLHSFSSKALSLRVMDVIDPLMLLEEENSFTGSSYQRDINERVQTCITSLVKVGVACSVESQSGRLEISDALMELHVIKEIFLGTRMH